MVFGSRSSSDEHEHKSQITRDSLWRFFLDLARSVKYLFNQISSKISDLTSLSVLLLEQVSKKLMRNC